MLENCMVMVLTKVSFEGLVIGSLKHGDDCSSRQATFIACSSVWMTKWADIQLRDSFDSSSVIECEGETLWGLLPTWLSGTFGEGEPSRGELSSITLDSATALSKLLGSSCSWVARRCSSGLILSLAIALVIVLDSVLNTGIWSWVKRCSKGEQLGLYL